MQTILLPIDDETEIKISLAEQPNTGRKLLEHLENTPPIDITKPEGLLDDLFQTDG